MAQKGAIMNDLIVFGEDHGGLPSSTQHLIHQLAKERKVLWINSIGLRQPKLSLKDGRRAVEKLVSFGRKGKTSYSDKASKNITVANLVTIPAPSTRYGRIVARELMLKQLKPIIGKLNLRSPILWTSLPTAADLCGHLNESAVVYYCGDDFSALAGVDHATVVKHEKKLVEKSDLILAASAKLQQKFPNAKTTLLEHGVDVELFSSPTKRAKDLPQTDSETEYVAGFYGSLSDWLDYELIRKMALQLPKWKFVFIGPNNMDSNPLPNLPNIVYLGMRTHNQLPEYSQHWDVSLLPFKDNEQIRACNPLKLREYIAAGRPIVSTFFPALDQYHSDVLCATNHKEFIRQMGVAVNFQNEPKRDSIIEQSWTSKGQLVSQLMRLL
jgi:glycosyltransferase involved in cell wall biosynthesis